MLHRGTWFKQRYVPTCTGNGLYILPEDAPVGESAISYLGLDDTVVEYEITSNRVDCFSILGIAREAAATFGKEFVPPVVTETGNNEDVNDYIKVSVKDDKLCSRYTARVVKISGSHRRRNGCSADCVRRESARSITL